MSLVALAALLYCTRRSFDGQKRPPPALCRNARVKNNPRDTLNASRAFARRPDNYNRFCRRRPGVRGVFGRTARYSSPNQRPPDSYEVFANCQPVNDIDEDSCFFFPRPVRFTSTFLEKRVVFKRLTKRSRATDVERYF